MTVLTEKLKAGNWLKYEESDAVTRDSNTLTNDTGGELDFASGTMLEEAAGVWTPTVSGDEANIDGILIPQVDGLANNGTLEVAMLVRGSAIINIDGIPKDAAGVAYLVPGLRTRLEALGFVVRDEPDVTETQTT